MFLRPLRPQARPHSRCILSTTRMVSHTQRLHDYFEAKYPNLRPDATQPTLPRKGKCQILDRLIEDLVREGNNEVTTNSLNRMKARATRAFTAWRKEKVRSNSTCARALPSESRSAKTAIQDMSDDPTGEATEERLAQVSRLAYEDALKSFEDDGKVRNSSDRSSDVDLLKEYCSELLHSQKIGATPYREDNAVSFVVRCTRFREKFLARCEDESATALRTMLCAACIASVGPHMNAFIDEVAPLSVFRIDMCELRDEFERNAPLVDKQTLYNVAGYVFGYAAKKRLKEFTRNCDQTNGNAIALKLLVSHTSEQPEVADEDYTCANGLEGSLVRQRSAGGMRFASDAAFLHLGALFMYFKRLEERSMGMLFKDAGEALQTNPGVLSSFRHSLCASGVFQGVQLEESQFQFGNSFVVKVMRNVYAQQSLQNLKSLSRGEELLDDAADLRAYVGVQCTKVKR